MQPDYTTLFRVHDPLAKRPMRLSPAPDPRYQSYFKQQDDKFPNLVFSLLRGEMQANPPLILGHGMGGKPTDIMWSTYPPIMVVSERVTDLFREEGFTGWGTYDVEIHDKEGHV